MNKQKLMRQKEPQHNKHRYQQQSTNYDSTPTLNRLRTLPSQNKENKNNINLYQNQAENFNNQRFQVAKSSQFTKRLRTTANDSDFVNFRDKKVQQTNEQVHSSQQFFRFRTKPSVLRQQNGFISQQLTFAEVNQKKGLLTSRDFMEQKKMKNEVIDEMISNAKRGLCKSFNEFSVGCFCINHPNKKAKYRLVSQLSEGQEQMFYCSKCAINLLQQNFKIQEVKAQDADMNASRLQQIARLQQKLKTLQNEAKLHSEGSSSKQELEMITQEIMTVGNKFEMMIGILQKMQNQEIEYLHGLYMKKENQEKIRKENVSDLMLELSNIQKEIVEYKQLKKFASMKENQFQFITTSLSNKLTKFAESIPQLIKVSPSRKLVINSLDQREVLEKLEEELKKKLEKEYTRRQREITFSRKEVKEFQKSEDQFICDELKRPFRVLFPSDEMQLGQSTDRHSDRNTMLQSVKQRPTFTQIEFE